MLAELVEDLRIGIRGLGRVPVLALTIILTVGLGIGATTAIFAAIDAAILRPLPYRDPGRLYRIYTDSPPFKFRFSVADYLALTAQQTSFERVAGYTGRAMAFSDGRVAERLNGKAVTWTYFSTLGIGPALGRDFTEQDGRPGSPQTAIVTNAFWQQRLGGRPDAIGKPVRLDGVDYTLVGVLPSSLGPLERGLAFFVAAQWEPPRRKGPFFITVVGRLKAGVDPQTAASELRTINKRIFPIWKSSYQDEKSTWSIMTLKADVIGNVNTLAGLALAAVALVWLIACANGSSLLVARVTSRRRELAVRTALGASRARVLRYLLAESAALACGAAIVGVAVAWGGIWLLRTAGTDYLPRTAEFALTGRVLWLLVTLTAASAMLFGLVPALHGTGGPVDDSLRAVGRTTTGNLAVRRLRRLLVGAQFAIATPLLIGAGLLLVSLNALGHVDLGFDPRNLASASVTLPRAVYADPAGVATFWDELQRRVEAAPGVTAMAYADGRPPNDVGNLNNFDLEDAPTPAGQSQPVTPWIAVTPDYFHLLGLKLVEGRLFDSRDGLGPNIETVIVDRAWEKRFFPNGSALGKRFREGGCTACPWTTVVGVVSDVKYAGLDSADQGSVYMPIPARGSRPSEDATTRFRYLIVRTAADPAAVVPVVRQIVRDLDPTLPFSDVALIDDLVDDALEVPRSLSLLVGGFAAVALVLSVVGIYGVMAYYVQQNARDISIRLALGGSRAAVLKLVVGQGLKVVMAGVAAGIGAALLLTRLMSSLLFGIGAADTFTYAVVALLLIGVALIACLIPARTATGLEPAVVLRGE